MTRLVDHTSEPMRHPWPEDCEVQGSNVGVVFRDEGNYQTAFVEAFPRQPATFLRGEGATVAEAEDACWERYTRMRDCPGHGPYERGKFRNGSAFCTQCWTWFPRVLEPLPKDETQPRGLMERALGDRDPRAAVEILETVAAASQLPRLGDVDGEAAS